MILYRVVDYLEVDKWFATRWAAKQFFERIFHDRAQEKSEMLEIRRYVCNDSPTEAFLNTLNGEAWDDGSTTIEKAKP